MATAETAPRDATPGVPVVPRQIVKRWVLGRLPRGRVCVSKPYLLALQECCSELVLFVAGEANDLAMERGAKMLRPEHAVEALEKLDLAHLARPMERYVDMVREKRKEEKRHRTQLAKDEEDASSDAATVASDAPRRSRRLAAKQESAAAGPEQQQVPGWAAR